MKFLALVSLPLIFISGCTSTDPVSLPDVTSLRSPVNAHSGIRHQRPRSLFAGYTNRSIEDPESWKQRNAPPTDWRNQSVDPERTSNNVEHQVVSDGSRPAWLNRNVDAQSENGIASVDALLPLEPKT